MLTLADRFGLLIADILSGFIPGLSAPDAAKEPRRALACLDAPRLPFNQALVQPVTELPPAVHRNICNKLVSMTELPIKQIKVIERYKSVFLIAFEVYGRLDPVLPIVSQNLGQEHNEAYGCLSNAISRWQPDFEQPTAHHSWVKECHHWARYVGDAALRFLPVDEADYYISQMLYSISFPMRNREHF